MTKRDLVVVGFALLCSLSGSAYIYWQTTPTYSFQKIVEAVQNKNHAQFEAYVDVDAMIDGAIDDLVSEGLTDLTSKDESGFAAMGAMVAGPIVKSLKPQIRSLVRSEIYKAMDANITHIVEGRRDFRDQLKKNKLVKIFQDLNRKESRFKFLEMLESTQSGDDAFVQLKFKDSQFEKEFVVEFKLNWQEKWKLTRINNLANLIGQREQWKNEQLSIVNEPVIKKMDRTLKVVDFHKKAYTGGEWGVSKKVSYHLELKNTSRKKIVAVRGQFLVMDIDGQVLDEFSLVINDKIKSGKAWNGGLEVSINQYIDKQKKLYLSPNEKLTHRLDIKSITFINGEKLQLADSLDSLGQKTAAR